MQSQTDPWIPAASLPRSPLRFKCVSPRHPSLQNALSPLSDQSACLCVSDPLPWSGIVDRLQDVHDPLTRLLTINLVNPLDSPLLSVSLMSVRIVRK